MRYLGMMLGLMYAVGATGQAGRPIPVRNLVMEGGGIRGIAYTGALEVLDSAGMLQQVERFGGTSAGALQAMLLVAGYSPAEIRGVLESTSFRKLNDGSFLGLPGLIRMRSQLGFYKGDRLHRQLGELLAAKTGDADITLLELYRRTGRSLYVTAVDLDAQRLAILSHETYPHMKARDAVRISASLPLYFRPLRVDSTGRTWPHHRAPLQAHLMIDGGMLANYPLFLFDSARYLSEPYPAYPLNVNPETVGLQLEHPDWMNDSIAPENRYPIRRPRHVLGALYKTVVDKPAVNGDPRTMLISTLGVSPRIRRMPKPKVEALIESGRQGARQYLLRQSGYVIPSG